MKSFIAFLFVLVSLADGKVVPSDSSIVSVNTIRDPPPASNVTVNATWAFSSGVNITNVVMTIYNLQSSQYAAMGLSQNASMVNINIVLSIEQKDIESLSL